MKVTVDSGLCAASASCVAICPEVFKIEGEVAEVITSPVPAEHEDAARQAADSCPTGAIQVEE